MLLQPTHKADREHTWVRVIAPRLGPALIIPGQVLQACASGQRQEAVKTSYMQVKPLVLEEACSMLV